MTHHPRDKQSEGPYTELRVECCVCRKKAQLMLVTFAVERDDTIEGSGCTTPDCKCTIFRAMQSVKPATDWLRAALVDAGLER